MNCSVSTKNAKSVDGIVVRFKNSIFAQMVNEEPYVDLATLLGAVKEMMSEAFPMPVWVKAEISSWSPRANGHCYLNLSESEKGKQVADIRAMIWKWNFPQLKAFFDFVKIGTSIYKLLVM